MLYTPDKSQSYSTCEILEQRRLLSAVVLAGPNLMVKGTMGDDTIGFALNADPTKLDVTFNGVTSTFDLAAVRRIAVNARAGNDVVSFGEGIVKRAYLQGGGGNDSLTGGAGKNDLLGGWGNDTMTGGADNDKFVGAGGDDSMVGGAGNDKLLGNGGADNLSGGDGDDRVFGGGGDDNLDGGAGMDTMNGAGGDDVLTGGDDDDVLSGGDGVDDISGGAGNDDFVGDDDVTEVKDQNVEDEGENDVLDQPADSVLA